MKRPEMTSRERILAAIKHQPTDRLPLDYWGVGEITDKLMKHFGAKNMIELGCAMDIDLIMWMMPPMIKKGRHGYWDVEMKKIPLKDGIGFYEEPVCHPIADYETINEIEANYEWPTIDMFDYSGIKADAKNFHDNGFAVKSGYISLTHEYTMIRGFEQMFVDFIEDPELADYILYKINEFNHAHTRKILEAGDGMIDITEVTDDLGSQTALLMSPSMIERYLGKYYIENIAMAKEYGAHVFHHDDGAITEIIPWIVEKGCEILNPLQWHLPGWDLSKLKRDYGSKLCFHGGVDNQLVLPFQGPEEVKAEVRACIDALYSDRLGYILAPCHNIQANTPLENILTMFDYAKEYEKQI